jgi:hypothetical protein
MPTFSFHHQVSSHPDVDSNAAVESLADLSDVTILRQEDVASRDGNLVETYVECEQEDCEEYIRSLRELGLLY